MDRELRDAFERQEAKLDKLIEAVNNHRIETASNIAALTSSTKSAHARISDHEKKDEKRRDHTIQLWFGIALAFGAEIIHWVFGGKKP